MRLTNAARLGEAHALTKFGFYSNLSDDEVKQIERDHHHGMTAHQLAAGVVGGKILLHNGLHRWGHHLAPVRWLGRQAAGYGFDQGHNGKEMLHPLVRNAVALGFDPALVSGYEKAHAVGSLAGGHTSPQELAKQLQNSAGGAFAQDALKHPDIAAAMKNFQEQNPALHAQMQALKQDPAQWQKMTADPIGHAMANPTVQHVMGSPDLGTAATRAMEHPQVAGLAKKVMSHPHAAAAIEELKRMGHGL